MLHQPHIGLTRNWPPSPNFKVDEAYSQPDALTISGSDACSTLRLGRGGWASLFQAGVVTKSKFLFILPKYGLRFGVVSPLKAQLALQLRPSNNFWLAAVTSICECPGGTPFCAASGRDCSKSGAQVTAGASGSHSHLFL